MSSGEVIFILAFIVLPTAILVSSVWAVVFVRRRPEGIAREPLESEPAGSMAQTSDEQQTAILATNETPGDQPVAASLEPAGEQAQEFPDAPVDPDRVVADLVPAPEEDSIESAEPEPSIAQEEPAVLQSTEDLDEVVAAVHSHVEDDAPEPAAPVESEAHEPVQDEVAQARQPQVEEQADERFETSELPLVTDQAAVETTEPADNRASRQRRKQSVKLLPGDPETPRQRGRNRESPRQVPQLSRAFRRKDEPQPDLPPDADSDPESTSARD